jgi:hypothetical protein
MSARTRLEDVGFVSQFDAAAAGLAINFPDDFGKIRETKKWAGGVRAEQELWA